MNLNEYQEVALTTAVYPGKRDDEDATRTLLGLWYCVTGLSGESGEALDKVKKLVRLSTPAQIIGDRTHNPNLTYEARDALAKELGDVLWYLANASWELGLTLEDIAKANIAKLRGRAEAGTLKGEGDDR